MAALDSSGWARSYASHCCTQRIKLKIKALKVTLLVDTKIQTVLDLHVAPARKRDTRIALALVKKNLERFKTLIGDKGYDDQAFRDWLSSCSKRPLIKRREFTPCPKVANTYMDQVIYHQRNLVEAVISVLKPKYGSTVSSRV